MLIHILTGHFFSYTFASWTLFCLQICGLLLQISFSTTTQRSGCRGSYLRAVNSLLCSRKQFEIISAFVTWRFILVDGAIRRWERCGHKGMDKVSNNIQWHLNDAQLVMKESQIKKKLFPTHYYVPTPLLPPGSIVTRWLHAFMLFMLNAVPATWMFQTNLNLIK